MKNLNKNKYRIMSGVLKYSFGFILAFALILPFMVVNADTFWSFTETISPNFVHSGYTSQTDCQTAYNSYVTNTPYQSAPTPCTSYTASLPVNTLPVTQTPSVSGTSTATPSVSGTSSATPSVSGTSTNTTKIDGGIDNPLPGINDIPSFIVAIIHIVLIIAIPIITLAIIYTGFLFVQAQGKPENLTKAKNALFGVLIGAAIILGAFVIASAIQGTVDQINSGNV